MKTKFIILNLLLAIFVSGSASAFKYVGGDISLLPEYEKAGAIYKDGNTSIKDFLVYCHDNASMNAMRVRLFVNPDNFPGSQDANACQNLDYIIPLCKRIKNAGYALMLDFHYSDTWADPSKQYTPEAWKNLSDTELCNKIYSYTKETLETLADNGIWPDMIQTGNEISYGMLWGPYGSSSIKKCYYNSDANWDRFSQFLHNAVKACREVCPQAKIVLHTERVANTSNLTSFYDKMKNYGIDYDIIGLSYYPYYHNKMSQLDSSLTALESKNYGKEIMIVETGWSYAWTFSDATYTVEYEASQEGQNDFTKALINTAASHPSVTGIFWWWMEYNAYNTSLSGWYNAPLIDSRDGKVQKALATLASFGDGTSLPKTTVEYHWLDQSGNVLGNTGEEIQLTDGKNIIQVGINGYASHQTARSATFKVYVKGASSAKVAPSGYSEAVLNTDYQILDGNGTAVDAYDENVNNMIKFLNKGDYYIEASMPADAAANSTYSVADASLYVNVSEETTTEPEPTLFPDFYLLYNNGGDWNYPGDKLTNNGDGTYTITHVSISGSDGGNGWFALTTSDSSNWEEADAGRYGPETNTVVSLNTELTVAQLTTTSWEIAAGTYDMTFDYNNLKLMVTSSDDTDENSGQEWYLTGQYNDWALEAQDMFDYSAGKYVKTVDEISKFLIVKDANWDNKYGGKEGETVELGIPFTLTAGGNDLTFGAGYSVTGATIILDVKNLTITVSGTLNFDEPELHLLGGMNGWNDDTGEYTFENKGDGIYMLYLNSLGASQEFKIATLDYNPEYSTSNKSMTEGEYNVITNGSNMAVGEDMDNVLLTLDTNKKTLTIQKNVPTGINGIYVKDENVEYFNLQGMKVQNPQKGIYIKKINDRYIKIIL